MSKKDRKIKPASDDPVREALGHPNGPSLLEMIGGHEEQELEPGENSKKAPDNPDIPII